MIQQTVDRLTITFFPPWLEFNDILVLFQLSITVNDIRDYLIANVTYSLVLLNTGRLDDINWHFIYVLTSCYCTISRSDQICNRCCQFLCEPIHGYVRLLEIGLYTISSRGVITHVSPVLSSSSIFACRYILARLNCAVWITMTVFFRRINFIKQLWFRLIGVPRIAHLSCLLQNRVFNFHHCSTFSVA